MGLSSHINPFSDEFSEEKKSIDHASQDAFSHAKNHFQASTYLFPIDESEEFYDPFSDLNLFLSKRIKRELLRHKNPVKWSRKIQSSLLKKILPDFTRNFPGYRLGNSAIQKIWEKILYYLKIVEQDRNALQANGKLNVKYLIKKNLTRIAKHASQLYFHPYNTTHKLAIKISECIATIDGDRPQIEELSKIIWSVQKHLIPPTKLEDASPFEEIEPLDKVIMRFQLQLIANQPNIDRKSLSEEIKKKIIQAKQIDKCKNVEDLSAFLSSYLANRLYENLSVQKKESLGRLHKLENYLEQEVQKDLRDKKSYLHIVQKLLFVHQLSQKLSIQEIETNLKTAFCIMESFAEKNLDNIDETTPVIREDVFALLEKEVQTQQKISEESPFNAAYTDLIRSFCDAKNVLFSLDASEMRILIWKTIYSQAQSLFKISNYTKKFSIEELENVYLNYPASSFSKVIEKTLQQLDQMRSMSLEKIDEKIHLWSIQNDMVCTYLYFDREPELLSILKDVWNEQQKNWWETNSENFIQDVIRLYVEKYPSLQPWIKALSMRATLLYKYFWYTQLHAPTETSYDLFLKWHFNEIQHAQANEFSELILTRLEELVESLLPLTPFNREYCRNLINEKLL